MKRLHATLTVFAGLVATSGALGGEANSSATAGNGRGRNGNAAASAGYTGDIGFARSDSNSGPISTARGVAVGFDERGLSLSVSNAIAPRHGPSIATNFNLSIGTDGSVSHSTGLAMALGNGNRSVTAGGSATAHRGGSARSFASGRSDADGRVLTAGRSESRAGRRLVKERRRGVRKVVRVKIPRRARILRPNRQAGPRQVRVGRVHRRHR